MSSHLNLVETILASKQFNLSRRTVKNPQIQTGCPIFEKILTKNLQAKPPVLPLTGETPEADAKFKEGVNFVLAREGSKHVREDGGRESSKYGILQSTAKEHGYQGNIKDITRDDAEAIYRKLWVKSGAESLPFPMSTVHFDTYVNSPSAAKKILEKSQGNTDAYLQLRQQRYVRLVEIKPERYGKYLKGWGNRIKNLQAMVGQHKHGASLKA